MSLNITINYPKIGIDIYFGSFNIKVSRADIRLKQFPADLYIFTPLLHIEIDMREPLNDIGLKDIRALDKDFAEKSLEIIHEQISEKSRQGDMMARIDKYGTDLIPYFARENTKDTGKELNVDCAPKSPPKIRFLGGGLRSHFQIGGVKLDAESSPPKIDAEPADVKVYLLEKGGIKVKVHNSHSVIDIKT